jgi:hypothetical protein
MVTARAFMFQSNMVETKEIDAEGKAIKHRTAMVIIGDPAVSREPTRTAYYINMSSKNPLTLSFLTPPICAELAVVVSNSGFVVATGRISRFPAFELNVTDHESRTDHNVPITSPGAGASPFRLVLPRKEVFVVEVLPLRPVKM